MNQEFFKPEEKYFGETLEPYRQQEGHTHVVLSGFPYDEGTRINGGRVGGSAASMIFRKALEEHELYRKGPAITVLDAGDIEKQLELPKAHEALFERNMEILRNPRAIGFVIGGSNDQSYPNVRALLHTHPTSRIATINIDAHFDVRPLKEGKAHSGSPFRLMLEDPLFSKNNSRFVEFACKGASCSNEHYQYLLSKQAKVVWLERDIRRHQLLEDSQYRTQAGQLMKQLLDELAADCDKIFFSFDIDSVSANFMPGVSAPSVVGGLTDLEAFELMHAAGSQPKVALVDCSQFNPAVQYQRSSKFLAQLFYTFCMAVANRQHNS